MGGDGQSSGMRLLITDQVVRLNDLTDAWRIATGQNGGPVLDWTSVSGIDPPWPPNARNARSGTREPVLTITGMGVHYQIAQRIGESDQ